MQDLGEEADNTVSPMEGKLTVNFEDPFWNGVFERIEDGKLSVCKVTFFGIMQSGYIEKKICFD